MLLRATTVSAAAMHCSYLILEQTFKATLCTSTATRTALHKHSNQNFSETALLIKCRVTFAIMVPTALPFFLDACAAKSNSCAGLQQLCLIGEAFGRCNSHLHLPCLPTNLSSTLIPSFHVSAVLLHLAVFTSAPLVVVEKHLGTIRTWSASCPA